MNLYLDDDVVEGLLIRLLRAAGHDVHIPADVGLIGRDDAVHLAHTIASDRVCITGNHYDFANLHNLVMTARGHHPGVLVIRKDNDRRRDLTAHGVVQALAKLVASGSVVRDSIHILNQWR